MSETIEPGDPVQVEDAPEIPEVANDEVHDAIPEEGPNE